MAVQQRDVVEREVRISARPETVFAFFTDPDKMIQWKGTRAELDPRPGGTYRVEMNEQVIARGEYVAIDAPRKVVFTWGWEGQETGEGWDMYLGRLAVAASGGDPGPDPNAAGGS